MHNPQTARTYNYYKQLPYDDRLNELVFIGIDMNKEKVIKKLDSCFVTDEEREQSFLSFEDPFEKLMKVS